MIDTVVEDKVLFRKTNVSIASTTIMLFRVGDQTLSLVSLPG